MESSIGAKLRHIGGCRDGERIYIDQDCEASMGVMAPSREIGAKLFAAEGNPIAYDAVLQQCKVSKYRKMRIRLATPSCVHDEVVMAEASIKDEAVKQQLAKLVGLELPVLHMFNVQRSSLVSYIAWDMDTGTMDVGMKNGGVYRYFGVDRVLAMEFLAADSLGTFYTARVRPLKSVRLNAPHSSLP